MEPKNVLPRLDLGGRKVPQLRGGNTGSARRQDEPVRDVVSQRQRPALSIGGTAPQSKGLPEAREDVQEAGRIHIALVVPDLKVFGSLKDSVYVLKPDSAKDYDIQVHVLVDRKGKDRQAVLFGFALTQLGLVEPSVAKLQYPEELELGWSDKSAPINEEG